MALYPTDQRKTNLLCTIKSDETLYRVWRIKERKDFIGKQGMEM